jgi:EutQ-like cupin domain
MRRRSNSALGPTSRTTSARTCGRSCCGARDSARSDDGDTFELGEGDVMTFVPGWSGEWTAHSRLRKIYCTFVPGAAG